MKAVLLDFDGTLWDKGRWLEGVPETLDWLLHNHFKVRIVTNMTLQSCQLLHRRFVESGHPLPLDWIITPARVAVQFFNRHPPERGILPLVHSNVLNDLEGLELRNDRPVDIVLVGDMAEEWSYAKMNIALRCLREGASLAALQVNRMWEAEEGPCIDAGAFVRALEYAAETTCMYIFGKPSPLFFQTILDSLHIMPHEAVMVGDDLEIDVLGAQQAGIPGLLVQTGESLNHDWGGREYHAAGVLERLGNLPKWLLRKQEKK